ncbi:hypothetical protein TNCV_4681191 [Trichonephila clavipes]|nr:hypothetical protein TNCV_4681191 [Trichonephila clavipes]
MGGLQGQPRSQISFSQAPSYVRKDTGAPSEGATCAWMAADKAVGWYGTGDKQNCLEKCSGKGQCPSGAVEPTMMTMIYTAAHRKCNTKKDKR